MRKYLGFLGNEIVLGTMIALLSVFTAVASYQGGMSDSEQNKYEILGMQELNDGNADYLSANQTWIQDDGNYDNWFINRNTNPDIAEYYQGNFTEELTAAIDRNGADVYPMDDKYSEAIYTDANKLWSQSDANFETATAWDNRGDQLELKEVVLAEEMKPNTTCRRPFHTMVLTWEGQAVICCVDYKREVKLGNIHEQSVYEIWNGPWATQLRKEYLAAEFENLPTCAKCTINTD